MCGAARQCGYMYLPPGTGITMKKNIYREGVRVVQHRREGRTRLQGSGSVLQGKRSVVCVCVAVKTWR